jgi:hypothetical protein
MLFLKYNPQLFNSTCRFLIVKNTVSIYPIPNTPIGLNIVLGCMQFRTIEVSGIKDFREVIIYFA